MSTIQELDVNELSLKLAQQEDVELIDIRSPAEVAQGVLPHTKTLPMHLMPLKLDYFTSLNKTIILYCRTGIRSAQACTFLTQNGINNVFSVKGGITSWKENGHPIETTPAGNIE